MNYPELMKKNIEANIGDVITCRNSLIHPSENQRLIIDLDVLWYFAEGSVSFMLSEEGEWLPFREEHKDLKHTDFKYYLKLKKRQERLGTTSVDGILSGKVNDTIFETVYEQGNIDHFSFQVNGKTVFKVPILDLQSIEQSKMIVAEKAIKMLVDRISKEQ